MFILQNLRKTFDDINCIKTFLYYYDYVNDWNSWSTIINCMIILKLSCERKKSLKKTIRIFLDIFLNKKCF